MNLILLAVVFIFIQNFSFAQGGLDDTFGTNGKVTTNITPSYSDNGKQVLIQKNGKIIVAGYAYNGLGESLNFNMVRYNTDGSLDQTFGFGGKIRTDFNVQDVAQPIAIQNDGKILVVGLTSNNGGALSQFAISRYDTSGILDKNFGNNGMVTINFGIITFNANCIIVQKDGKIVLGGSAWDGFNINGFDFGLARFDSNGKVDSTFNNDGIVYSNFQSGLIKAIAIQDDGKIVATGSIFSGSNHGVARYESNGSLDSTFGSNGVAFPDFVNGFNSNSIGIQNGKIIVAGTTSGNGNDFAVARFNSNGSKDLNFGSNGKMITDYDNSNDNGNSMVIQKDGKIVVAGFSLFSTVSDFSIARYDSNGTLLDNTFGTNGLNKAGFINSEAFSVALQPDGNGGENLIMAGTVYLTETGGDFGVVKFTPNGSLDNSFGIEGKVTTDLGDAADVANSAVIQDDGKILVAGYTSGSTYTNVAIARYNTDGSLDTSFDKDGRVITNLSVKSSAASIAMLPGNKIVVAGNYGTDEMNNDFLICEYNPDGSPDAAFQNNGSLTIDLSGKDDFANAVAVQSNGKILVAGSTTGISGSDFALVRINTDGNLDMSFNNNTGKTSTDFGSSDDMGSSVVIQSDGKIIVAGSSSNGINYDFAMVRYNSDGTIDKNFGSQGKVKTDIQNSEDFESSEIIQPDGKIILVGYSSIMGGSYNLSMARYNSNGIIDNSFGTNGKVITNLGTSYGYSNSSVLQTDGKIDVLWNSFNGNDVDFTIVRYNSNGSLDKTFGTNGVATIDFGNSNDVGSAISLQKDGKIIAAGSAGNSYTSNFAILRYNSTYPVFQVSSQLLQFGNVIIDSSLTKSFSLTNTGSEDLKIDSIVSSSNVFTVSPNNTQIQPGNSENINVIFTPDQPKSYSGNLIIYHNASGSPDTIIVTGIGKANSQPAISLSANEINFGEITVNSSLLKNLAVKNIGGALLKIDSITINKNVFAVDTMKFDLPAGDSLELKVTFTPKDTFNYSGTLKIYNNGSGSPTTVNLTGKGTNQKVAIITLSTKELNFGEVTINDSTKMHFNISNTGTSDLHVDSIVSQNKIFTVEPVSFIIKPDSGKDVTVTFSPFDSIAYTSTLKIYHNAAGSPGSINLTGNGVSPNKPIIKLSSLSLAFGDVIIGNSETFKLNLQNTGKVNLNIDSIKSSSLNFSVNRSNFVVKPDSNKDISVTFTPEDSIAYSGFLNIYHNATGSLSTVSLSGRGAPLPKAIISISATSLSFGDLLKGSSSTLNFSVKNSGLADLIVDSIKSNNNVFTISPTNFVIKPDSDINVSVTFSPQDSLRYIGKISIYYNMAIIPAIINISGNGFIYPAVLSANQTITFGNITNINNYKIIGVPGNSNIAVSSLTQGDYQYDWNVYDDNGDTSNYLTTNSNIKFTPGKAYWLISGSSININQQITPVQLSSDNTFSIPLHSSWNLISNPFEKNITWQNVQNLNGLPSNSILYYWNGSSFSNPSLMLPYQGYYFNNSGNLNEIKVHYEPHLAAGKISKAPVSSINTKNFLELSVNDKKINQASSVFFGIDSLSKEGIDNYDYFAPPADFQKVRINIVRSELPKREKYLFVEQRPEIKDGQEFELEIKAVPNDPVNITVGGISNFSKYNIYILDERLKNLYNLKEEPVVKLNLAHKYNNFKLLIGTDEYLNQIKQQLNPAGYQLYQNYPNPFNPSTIIRFSTLKQENISLKVYNILGQIVRTLIDNQIYDPGTHEVEFNGNGLASGIYIFRLESINFTMQRKMVLIK